MERYTLVTKLAITRPDGITNMTDVSTKVEHTARRTTIIFGSGRGHQAIVTLTEAERIALIEALGGRA